jgi:UDP-glucose 4-epimerase
MAGPILITGGAGFIGSHLVERLASAGHEVHVLDDLSRGRREWLPDGVDLHRDDLRDYAAVRETVTSVRARAIVHLAALHFIPDVDGAPELAWQVNVDGTMALLTALRGHPPELFVFASSAAVYPDRRGPISESCPVAPVDLYGRTKAAGERLVTSFAAETGARPVVARLFNVVGDRETNPHVVPELIRQLGGGAGTLSLGNVDTARDYTDVIDVAEALERLLSADIREAVVNVGSGRGVSVGELVSICAGIVGRPLSVTVDPSRLRDRDRKELVADVSLLRRTTGWSPRRTIEETLRELLLR